MARPIVKVLSSPFAFARQLSPSARRPTCPITVMSSGASATPNYHADASSVLRTRQQPLPVIPRPHQDEDFVSIFALHTSGVNIGPSPSRSGRRQPNTPRPHHVEAAAHVIATRRPDIGRHGPRPQHQRLRRLCARGRGRGQTPR